MLLLGMPQGARACVAVDGGNLNRRMHRPLLFLPSLTAYELSGATRAELLSESLVGSPGLLPLQREVRGNAQGRERQIFVDDDGPGVNAAASARFYLGRRNVDLRTG